MKRVQVNIFIEMYLITFKTEKVTYVYLHFLQCKTSAIITKQNCKQKELKFTTFKL